MGLDKDVLVHWPGAPGVAVSASQGFLWTLRARHVFPFKDV